VLTSKHHEGYCLWNSTSIPTTWNWNVMDVGPRRDLLGELSRAVKNTTSPHTNRQLKFGVYHSLYEWFNPLYLQDKKNKWSTRHFVDLKTLPELYDLVERYEPELVWSDGEWEASCDYWRAREFLNWYGAESKVAETAVYNDRWGSDTLCKHGGYLTCSDRFQPDRLVSRKWENSYTIDKTSYGLNRNATYADYLTVKELVVMLIRTISKNGNLLLNIGPGADGTIDPIFVDRLLGIGDWLRVNGDAIYGTRPWSVCQNETATSVFYTRKSDRLYAVFTEWPSGNVLEMQCPIATAKTEITMLGVDDDLAGGSDGFIGGSEPPRSLKDSPIHHLSIHPRHATAPPRAALSGIRVELPVLTPDLVPCQHAWVLVLTGLGNLGTV